MESYLTFEIVNLTNFLSTNNKIYSSGVQSPCKIIENISISLKLVISNPHIYKFKNNMIYLILQNCFSPPS